MPVLSKRVIQALGSLADQEDNIMRIANSVVGESGNGGAAPTLFSPLVDWCRPQRPTTLAINKPANEAAFTFYSPVGDQPAMSWLYNPMNLPHTPVLTINNQEQHQKVPSIPLPIIDGPPALTFFNNQEQHHHEISFSSHNPYGLTFFNREQQEMAELHQNLVFHHEPITPLRPLARYPQTPLFDPYWPSPVIDPRSTFPPKFPTMYPQTPVAHFDSNWPVFTPVIDAYSSFLPNSPLPSRYDSPSLSSPHSDETDVVEAAPVESSSDTPCVGSKRQRGRPKKVVRTPRTAKTTPKARGTKRSSETDSETPVAKRVSGRPKRTAVATRFETHDEEDEYRPNGY